MCSISGIIAKGCCLDVRYSLDMMKILKHRGKDGSGLYVDDDVYYFKEGLDKDNLKLDKTFFISFGHNRLAIVGRYLQPISNEDESLWVICNGEIYNYIEIMNELKEHTFKTDSDSEVILHLYEDKALYRLDGDYAYAIYDKKKNILILGRDRFGVKPLFYVDTDKYFAFSSERKALYHLLININKEKKDLDYLNSKIKRLKPNSYLIYYLDNLRYEIIEKEIVKNSPELNISYNKAVDYLDKILKKAVYKRVRGLDRVGVICSGGLDSSLIAYYSSKYVNTTLYAVGTEDSEDLKYAQKLANYLNLELKTYIINENEFEEHLFKVVKALDDINLLNLSVGIPIYLSTKLAKEDKLKVVLSGQGADEIFGGYKRHENSENLKEELIKDIKNLYKVNLERDDHCSMANTIELRVPFLDSELVDFSLSLPESYLKGELRKKILRDVAKKYLPEDIALRPKKAAQYGTKSEKMIYKVAKKYGFSKKNINKFLEFLKEKYWFIE
ncbi:asparagine synthase (glutamine-hydrolyzing) [Methanocaldococcus indicus]|uniref:asparagine synthase (glutamine-hydrolyzing) n=1 Tax=Methanocaldococcus indicus TaxID=213231 RepID=UPI003C6CE13B